MSAGVFGYLGYDMVRRMEKLAAPKPDPIGVPDALLIRPTVMVVFDAARDEMVDRHARFVPRPASPRALPMRPRCARLDAVVAALEAPLDHSAMEADPLLTAEPPVSNTTDAEYMAMVGRRRTISPRATPSRSCCRSASRAASICLPSRFTGR